MYETDGDGFLVNPDQCIFNPDAVGCEHAPDCGVEDCPNCDPCTCGLGECNI